MADETTRAIERKLDRIRSLGLEALRLEWRRLYHSGAPRISRDLLVLGLGYKLQEMEHGGLSKGTRRKLQTIAKALRATGRVGATPTLSLKPGARLVREWRGHIHTVTVMEDGFEYAGTSYPSLTKIANRSPEATGRVALLWAGCGRDGTFGQWGAEWLAQKRHRDAQPKGSAVRSTRESRRTRVWNKRSTRSMPSVRPAPPLSCHRNTRAG